MLRFFAISIIFAAALLAGAYEQAAERYGRGDYDQVLRLLEPVGAKTPEIYALLGKAHYAKGDFKAATEALEKAVKAAPANAHYWNWLGKAYGRRAENAGFLTAPRYAVKCRKAFEAAVRRAPDNIEAINDLFSYYLDAPGFLGGGTDKAQALAERLRGLNLAEHHWALAELAAKKKEHAEAERRLRAALELEPRRIGRMLDLAKLLARQGKLAESEELFDRASRIAPDQPKVLLARAGAYIRAGAKLDDARKLLEAYLAAKLTPEDPPRWEAERLLAKLNSH